MVQIMQGLNPHLSLWRNIKIAFFHLGSGMADVMATGVWNRIMISDLGFSATPIGLLIALRYFLSPLGIWAGKMSDRRSVLGFRRLFWIWLGRGMMALSVAVLGFATADLVRDVARTGVTGAADAWHWLLIIVSLVTFSLGNALSGSTFLALIYDRSAPHQRGRAVGVVWTFLLLGFTVGGILFAVLLPAGEGGRAVGALAYSPDALLTLFLIAAGLLAALWFFSLLGEEKRSTGAAVPHGEADPAMSGADPAMAGAEHNTSIRRDLKIAWASPTMRAFFGFLALSMLFAFSQDLILEPFGAEVFGMDARVTTRFTAYWGSMSILATVVFLVLGRRFRWLNNMRMSMIGVAVLAATFALFAFAAFAEVRGLITVGLITLGIGLGIWNVGALGLMTEMSPFGRAGTFLGFWTLVVTLARGVGVSGGGIARDVMLTLTSSPALSYGLVFLIAGAGLVVSMIFLRRADTSAFDAEYQARARAEAAAERPAQPGTPLPERVFAGSMD
jgi:BCD family chlorophyll transporter-like MFS transporter